VCQHRDRGKAYHCEGREHCWFVIPHDGQAGFDDQQTDRGDDLLAGQLTLRDPPHHQGAGDSYASDDAAKNHREPAAVNGAEAEQAVASRGTEIDGEHSGGGNR
jgi:hypothetical protein